VYSLENGEEFTPMSFIASTDNVATATVQYYRYSVSQEQPFDEQVCILVLPAELRNLYNFVSIFSNTNTGVAIIMGSILNTVQRVTKLFLDAPPSPPSQINVNTGC
jgi:hypothetical protein